MGHTRTRLKTVTAVLGTVALGAAFAAGLAACQSSSNDTGTIQGGGGGQSSIVTMSGIAGGPSGTATLLESPSLNLSIEIDLTGETTSPSEPAAVYPGTCTSPGKTQFLGLAPVMGNKSKTPTLNSTLDELSSSPYMIVVFSSGVQGTPISCGTIPQLATPSP
ncbi:MAG TPA: hypothetical protein VKY26_02300 [Actinomycetota bacterium]|nr:hypothetical protein [Actinomycetota bacterium]